MLRKASPASRGARDGWSPWRYFAFVGDDGFGSVCLRRQHALDDADDELDDPGGQNCEC